MGTIPTHVSWHCHDQRSAVVQQFIPPQRFSPRDQARGIRGRYENLLPILLLLGVSETLGATCCERASADATRAYIFQWLGRLSTLHDRQTTYCIRAPLSTLSIRRQYETSLCTFSPIRSDDKGDIRSVLAVAEGEVDLFYPPTVLADQLLLENWLKLIGR